MPELQEAGKVMDRSERNEMIVAMRRKGATYGDIGRRFGITAMRAHQICEKAGQQEKLDRNDVFALLSKAETILGNQCGSGIVRRAYNVMRRKGVDDADALAKVKLKDVAMMRNAGVKTVALVAIAKELVD